MLFSNKSMNIKNILNLLRDPIWSAIAAFIVIIGALMNYGESMPNRLSIVPNDAFSEFTKFYPNSKMKLSIEGETIELKNTFYTYLWIANSSSSNIRSEDFQEKIGVRSNNPDLEITLVSSCKDIGNPQNLTKVNTPSFVWSKNASIWEIEPELINSGESGCSLIIVKSNQAAPIRMSDFSWSGRVVGHNVKIYDSLMEYSEDNKKLSDYLLIYISMTTAEIIWFLIIQCVLSLITILLINKIWFSNKFSILELSKFCFIFLLTTTTSEIIVSIFISSVHQHPIAWLLLVLHFLVFSALAYKIYFAKNQVIGINKIN